MTSIRDTRGADDGLDARGVRRVRTLDDHRPGHRRDGTQSRPRRMVRRLAPLRLHRRPDQRPPRPRRDRGARGRCDLRPLHPRSGGLARGHRTKSGKPWNHMAVLTVLRNRAYPGEVYFRDAYHHAPHRPLVETDTFDLAQRILAARGEDYSHRAANASDYLLAGLLTCSRCGKRFVGTAAHGNRYHYRYYTCFSRQRYGTDICNAERLAADALDAAVLEALLDTYTRSDLFETALAAAAERAGAVRAQHQGELAVVDTEAARTEEAIERYLLASEAGTLPGAQCGARIRTRGAKAAELRTRRAELVELIAAADAPEAQRATLANGEAATKKWLLQNLVHDIRVEGRHQIKPYFRPPIGPTTVTNPDPSTQGKRFAHRQDRSAPSAGAGPVLRHVVRLSRWLQLV
ncbi:MAG: recombinase zinc beta ribbon domain-containing protein [Acidimicrobiales bacterium]